MDRALCSRAFARRDQRVRLVLLVNQVITVFGFSAPAYLATRLLRHLRELSRANASTLLAVLCEEGLVAFGIDRVFLLVRLLTLELLSLLLEQPSLDEGLDLVLRLFDQLDLVQVNRTIGVDSLTRPITLGFCTFKLGRRVDLFRGRPRRRFVRRR